MLTPSGDWYWYLDDETNQLMVCLGDDLHFTTGFNKKVLTPMANQPVLFNVDHMAIYSDLTEKLEDACIELSAPQKTQIVLNGLAALLFHKPVMPKSWLFETTGYGVFNERLCSVETRFGQAAVFILESGEDTSSCLLLSDVKVSENKEAKAFTLFKIANDRFTPLSIQSQNAKIA